MRHFQNSIVILAFALAGPASTLGAAPLYRYVTTLSGLYLRSLPDQSGARLTLIPFNTLIAGSEITKNEVTVDDQKGHWIKTQYLGKTGWVFDGFLSDSPTPDGKMHYLSPDGRYYFVVSLTVTGSENGDPKASTVQIFAKDGKEILKLSPSAGTGSSDYPETNLPRHWIGSRAILFQEAGGGDCIPRKEYQYRIDVPGGKRTEIFRFEYNVICGPVNPEVAFTICKLDRCYSFFQAPGEALKIYRGTGVAGAPAAIILSTTAAPFDPMSTGTIDPGDPESPDVSIQINGVLKSIEEWIKHP